MASRRAYKEHRKSAVIAAYARTGSIVGAARAARISTRQIHRWLKDDLSFAAALASAKLRQADENFQTLESALNLFCDIVRPIVPAGFWPRIRAELALAVANLRNELKERRSPPRAGSSGDLAGVSLPHRRAEDVAIQGRGRGTSALDL